MPQHRQGSDIQTTKMPTVLTVTAVTVATLATGSFAQEQCGKMFSFETVDADKVGQATEAELGA